MKDNFKTVDIYTTEENVNSHFKKEFIPKEVEPHLTIYIVYNLKTHITDRSRTYNMTFFRLSKSRGRYNRDLTPSEIEKCKKYTLVIDGDKCVSKVLHFLLKFRGEPRKTFTYKFVECNSQLHAHIGSGFDSWILLNILPCDKHIVDIIKNGKGIISMRVFNGYIDNNKKQSSHYLSFTHGMTHLNYSLRK